MNNLILIVDDDAPLLLLLQTILIKEKYSVITASSGEEAIEKAKKARPQLVLLDISLPGIDGYEVCERLKQNAETLNARIIMLTEKDSADEITRGLYYHADDYITKPFDKKVLLARIHAVLRRMDKEERHPVSELQIGDLIISQEGREARVGKRKIDLTCNQFEILLFLALNLDKAKTRQEINAAIKVNTDTSSKKSLDNYIAHLREKIAGSGVSIDAVPGYGFKMRSDLS